MSALNLDFWEIVKGEVSGEWPHRNKERWAPLLNAMDTVGAYDDFEIWRYVHDNRARSAWELGQTLGDLISGAGVPVLGIVTDDGRAASRLRDYLNHGAESADGLLVGDTARRSSYE